MASVQRELLVHDLWRVLSGYTVGIEPAKRG
jgi:hypothetical protein